MTTDDYYQHHAQQFFDDTVAVDMSAIRGRFMALLPANGMILDAGCGSGRDAKAFADAGFKVEAFDASAELVALASKFSGLPIRHMRFAEINAQARYGGIWSCASLLHVSAAKLPDIMTKLTVSLKPDGIIYVSFKYGTGERELNGRRFTDMDETGLADLVGLVPGLRLKEWWLSQDQRPDRIEQWLNAFLIKPHEF